MPIFNITITRTGGISVKADTLENAYNKVEAMNKEELESHAQLTGWEVSDGVEE